MNYMEQIDSINNIVRRVFRFDDITYGDSRNDRYQYIVRYRGRLISEDTEAAYDQLTEDLHTYHLMPLFRIEDGSQVVYLIPEKDTPKPSNPWVNLILFVITLFSVMFTGALYGVRDPLDQFSFSLSDIVEFIFNGWPFAVSMLAILAAHEFGHYLAGRYHGTHVTLPYFLPFPGSPFGTLGAFINMKEPPKNRRVLLDIGLAGPLSGLVVAIPVLLLGLSLSSLDPLPVASSDEIAFSLEGNSVLYLFAKFLVFGRLLPAPPDFGGMNEILYWIRYFFTGKPFPFGGMDVLLHPVAWAGWAGLLVTAINLIPAGQLDGGHMIYVLLGRDKAKRLLRYILIFLLLLGFVWTGWWLWAALIYFLGRAYAEPLDQITQLDERRKKLAIFALVVFVLTFVPVPLSLF